MNFANSLHFLYIVICSLTFCPLLMLMLMLMLVSWISGAQRSPAMVVEWSRLTGSFEDLSLVASRQKHCLDMCPQIWCHAHHTYISSEKSSPLRERHMEYKCLVFLRSEGLKSCALFFLFCTRGCLYLETKPCQSPFLGLSG